MLYKYCFNTRFFEDGLIRFTQPIALNDPDDARPELVIGKFAPEDYARAREEAKRSGLNPISTADLESIFLTPFPSRRYDEKSFPGLWPATEPRLRKEPFSTLAEMDLAFANRAVELCMTTADETLGVLSLSASMGEQMWAYYGSEHRGIAIGFNETHPFFGKNAHPIEYSDEPFYVTTNSGWVRVAGSRWDNNDILERRIGAVPQELFFRKRLGWSHEKEWRMIKLLTLTTGTGTLDPNGYPVHLVEVPAVALQKVVFGYRASVDLIDSTFQQISKKTRWDHVEVARRKRLGTGVVVEERLR